MLDGIDLILSAGSGEYWAQPAAEVRLHTEAGPFRLSGGYRYKLDDWDGYNVRLAYRLDDWTLEAAHYGYEGRLRAGVPVGAWEQYTASRALPGGFGVRFGYSPNTYDFGESYVGSWSWGDSWGDWSVRASVGVRWYERFESYEDSRSIRFERRLNEWLSVGFVSSYNDFFREAHYATIRYSWRRE